MQSERLDALRRHLFSHGTSSIQALADSTGASVATVRRDLQILEQQGIVSRTHGGAQIADSAETEVAFGVRENQNIGVKRAIGAAAYDMIEPHTSVFFDAGTTVLQLVRCLRVRPMPLSIFTNGLIVAQELMNVAGLKVTVIGGQLRNENASLVGPAAEAALDRLWFDHLFLGATAIGNDHGIYSLDAVESSLNQRMQTRAARITVLADASKFGRRSTYLVSELSSATEIVSDESLTQSRQSALRDRGVPLTLVRALASPEATSHRFAAARG